MRSQTTFESKPCLTDICTRKGSQTYTGVEQINNLIATYTHTHTHTHTHMHMHTQEQGTRMCTFASFSMSLGSCFICFSSYSTSASKSDLAFSSNLIFSSSCDSLVLDSNCSCVAMYCCAQEYVLKRDTHNKVSESALLPGLSSLH